MATASDFVPQNPPTHQLEFFSSTKVFNVGTFQEGLALNVKYMAVDGSEIANNHLGCIKPCKW